MKIFIQFALTLAALILPVSNAGATFSYIYDGDGVRITGYTGGLNAIIPKTIDGRPVTKIGTSAFNVVQGNSNITNVFIPETVTHIYNVAFYGTSLRRVQLPDGLEYIGSASFGECNFLTSTFIPSNVTTIVSRPFESCTNLTEILVDSANPNYMSRSGVLFNKSGSTLIQYPPGAPGRYAIPTGVTKIGLSAFRNSLGLERVIVPSTVTEIDNVAFQSCPSLSSVFFLGNKPAIGTGPTRAIFHLSDNVIVYYMPQSLGWTDTFDLRPALLWNPQISFKEESFSISSNSVSFSILGTTNIPIVLEKSLRLSPPDWNELLNCNLTNGSINVVDENSVNTAMGYYRILIP